MTLTQDQIKGRLKVLAAEKGADARMLLRLFMMERFLERLSVSEYNDRFVIKGGILVTSLVGISMRSTMDIDASIKGWSLNADEAMKIIGKIASIDINDGVKFVIKRSQTIMDDFEYPGIRIHMNGVLEKIDVPMKIDISTNDIITPKAIEYRYPVMLENRKINIWTYNLETVFAEKVQTILARGIFNTRMRDFYDIHILAVTYGCGVDKDVLHQAFTATCLHRGHLFAESEAFSILDRISVDNHLAELWGIYKKKYPYAVDVEFSDTINSLKSILKSIYINSAS